MKRRYRHRVALTIMLILVLLGPVSLGSALLLAGSSSTTASGECIPAGDSAAGGEPAASGSLAEQQDQNAREVDRAAIDAGLSGRATLLALIAAVGESDLINLDHGDSAGPDSRGILQQRPSQGWGTEQQVMDPYYAATSFLIGPHHDRRGGLVTVQDWATGEPTLIISQVQRNSDPQHYARFQPRAEAIAKRAGIDLQRAGSTATEGNTAAASAAPMPAAVGGCSSRTAGEPPPEQGDCPLDAPGKVSCNVALAWEKQQADSGSREWHNWCLKQVSTAYGSAFAGYPNAYSAAVALQSRGQMHGTPGPKVSWADIPRGAVLWWDGRAVGNDDGHVAIYAGNGWVWSSDAPVADGRIGLVPVSTLDEWGQYFMGYSAGYVAA